MHSRFLSLFELMSAIIDASLLNRIAWMTDSILVDIRSTVTWTATSCSSNLEHAR